MQSVPSIRRRDLLKATAAAGAAAAFPFPGDCRAEVAQRKALDRRDRRGRPGRLGHRQLRQREHRRPVRRGRPPLRGLGAAVPQGEAVPRLPQDVRRDGQADRRGGGGHARPHPRPGRRHGHAAGQALLLREAAGAHGLRGPRAGRASPGRRSWPRRWARRSTPETITAASWSWSRPARSARSARSTSGWGRTSTGRPSRSAAGSPTLPRKASPSPRRSTGTSGSGLRRFGRTAGPTCRSSGVTGGPSATASWAISSATSATWPFGP